MIQGLGLIEQVVQLGIVLIDRTLESRTDDSVTRFVMVPPRAFELEHRLVPFADHVDSLAGRPVPIQGPPCATG
ncbi:MAG TPA: hypothetical protein VGK49_01905 [Ilumatobacteraceae bacterium]